MNLTSLPKKRGNRSCLTSFDKFQKTTHTKKMGKIISKFKGSQTINHSWGNFFRNMYARLLLQFSMNNLPFEHSFTQLLSNATNRTPAQIYSYHSKMLNEHGSIRQIIFKILGHKVEKKKQKHFVRSTSDQLIHKKDISVIYNQVQLDNQQKSLDSNEINYLYDLLLCDSLPDDWEQEFYLNKVQMLDLEEDQFQYKQESHTADNQQFSIQSEEEMAMPTQTDFFSSSL